MTETKQTNRNNILSEMGFIFTGEYFEWGNGVHRVMVHHTDTLCDTEEQWEKRLNGIKEHIEKCGDIPTVPYSVENKESEPVENNTEINEDKLYEQFKSGEIILEDLMQGQKVRFLIRLRVEKKVIDELENSIISRLKDDEFFAAAEFEGVSVNKKYRPTITLNKDADLVKIRSLYPNICKSQDVLHQDKLSEKVWEYLKAQPEAVEEVITVDAKKLNDVTKEYTQQKITTYIEVKGL